jgi:hypothetical protein
MRFGEAPMIAALTLMMAVAAQDMPPPLQLPPPKPKLICRADEQQVGSHIHTGRRCKTAEEWQVEDQRRDAVSPSMRITEGQGDALTPKTRPPV